VNRLAAGFLFLLSFCGAYGQEQSPDVLLHAAQCLSTKQFLAPSKNTLLTFGYLLDSPIVLRRESCLCCPLHECWPLARRSVHCVRVGNGQRGLWHTEQCNVRSDKEHCEIYRWSSRRYLDARTASISYQTDWTKATLRDSDKETPPLVRHPMRSLYK